MANEIETPMTISSIQLNDGQEPHPIDALYVNHQPAENIGTLVNTFEGNVSDDTTYPSAKLVWNTIGDIEQRLSNI